MNKNNLQYCYSCFVVALLVLLRQGLVEKLWLQVAHLIDGPGCCMLFVPLLALLKTCARFEAIAAFWFLSHITFPNSQTLTVSYLCLMLCTSQHCGKLYHGVSPASSALGMNLYTWDILASRNIITYTSYWPCCRFCLAVAARMLWDLWSSTTGSRFQTFCPCFPWLTSKGSKTCAFILAALHFIIGKPSLYPLSCALLQLMREPKAQMNALLQMNCILAFLKIYTIASTVMISDCWKFIASSCIDSMIEWADNVQVSFPSKDFLPPCMMNCH